MEGIVTSPETNPPAAEGQRLNFVQRLVGIYISPQETFEDIVRKGSWLPMYLILAILTCTMIYLVPVRLGPDLYKEKVRETIEGSFMAGRMTPEQLNQAVEQSLSPGRRYFGLAITPVIQLAVFVIVAAACLLIFVLLGAQINFKKSMAVTMWGMVPPGIVSILLSILVMFAKDPSTLDADPSNILTSNLGMLASRKEQPILHSLLGSFDVFSLWTIILLSIGFSVASGGKLSKGKSAAGILALWVVYVLGKLGVTAIFS